MNKNFKVIQIKGLFGLLLFVFVLSGLIFGFALFPIWLIMSIWNYIIPEYIGIAEINYFQSSLLWLAITLSLYAIAKNSISIKIQKENSFDSSEIEEMVAKFEEEEKSQNE